MNQRQVANQRTNNLRRGSQRRNRLQGAQLELPIEGADAEWFQLLARRNAALESLLQSLKHLARERCFSILTSSLTIEQLEDLARFQASKDKI